METVNLKLFGRIRLSSGAKTVEFSGLKRGAVLAYLAASATETVSRAAIADALWPDGDPDANRNRLRQELSALRHHLEQAGIPFDQVILASRSDLELLLPSHSIDVRQYRETIRNAARATDTTKQEQLLSQAVAFYSGPFLMDYGLPWVVALRASLLEDQKAALSVLANFSRDRGETGRATEWLRKLIAIEPACEAAHIQIMRNCIEAGQPALAVQQYRLLENLLRTELDAPPSREAQALLSEIRRNWPASLGSDIGGRATTASSSVLQNDQLGADLSAGTRNAESYKEDRVAAPRSRLLPSKPNFRPALWTAFAACLAIAVYFVIPKRSHSSHMPARPVAPLPAMESAWQVSYRTGPGEKENAEPTCVVARSAGYYVCGFTDTVKDDVDILVQQYSLSGSLNWSKRYSSPEGDMDRAYAVVARQHDDDVMVAGETYVPEGRGVQEGTRFLILHYNHKGELCQAVRHRALVWAGGGVRYISARSDGESGLILAGTATENGSPVAMVARYGPNCEPVWTRKIAVKGARGTILKHLNVSEHQFIYVCGEAEMSPRKSGRDTDGFVCRLNNSGEIQWLTPLAGEGHGQDRVIRTVVDGRENVVAAGEFFMGDPGQGGPGTMLGVARLLPDGSVDWFRTCKSTGPQFNLFDATEIWGCVVAVGSNESPDQSGEAITACYDRAGNVAWVNRFGRPDGSATTAVRAAYGEEFAEVAVLSHNDRIGTTGTQWKLMEYDKYGRPASCTPFKSTAESRYKIDCLYRIPGGVVVAYQSGEGEKHRITLAKFLYRQ